MLRSVFWSNKVKLSKIVLAVVAVCPLAAYATLGSAPGANTRAVAATRSLLQSAAPFKQATAIRPGSITGTLGDFEGGSSWFARSEQGDVLELSDPTRLRP